MVKRGLALGIMRASMGVSGTSMPFMWAPLLNTYGYVPTLGAFAVAMVVLTGMVLLVLKGRLPASKSSGRRRIDMAFPRKPLFYFFAASVFLKPLGPVFRTSYLPSYVDFLGYSPSTSTLLLAVYPLIQVFGQIATSYLRQPLAYRNLRVHLALCLLCLPPPITLSLLFSFLGGVYMVL